MVVDAGTLAVDGGGAGPGGQEGHHDGHAVQRDHHHDAGDDPGGRQVADAANTDDLERIDLLIDSHRTHLSGGAGTTAIYGQGSGVYDHYFNTFLSPRDLIWSFLQVVAITVVVMLVHTYYGYTASGGPAGVGEAVGRAVRTSMVVAAVEIVMITLAVYGQSGNFHLAG